VSQSHRRNAGAIIAEAQSPQRHRPSQHHHSIITASSQHHHSIITASQPPPCYSYIIAEAQSPHRHRPSQHHHSIITASSQHHHSIITASQPPQTAAITLENKTQSCHTLPQPCFPAILYSTSTGLRDCVTACFAQSLTHSHSHPRPQSQSVSISPVLAD